MAANPVLLCASSLSPSLSIRPESMVSCSSMMVCCDNFRKKTSFHPPLRSFVLTTVAFYIKKLHQNFSKKLHHPPAIPLKKGAKRPPSLKINIVPPPSLQERGLPIPAASKASTTVSDIPPSASNGSHSRNGDSQLRKRSVGKLATNAKEESTESGEAKERRRGTIQLAESADVAGDDSSRRLSWSGANMFMKKAVSLEYNRETMKRPESTDVSSGSPMEETLATKGKVPSYSEDSYIPKIAEHTKSWPYIMARNYFLLDNIKLFITFFINILLLTYKVEL